MKFLGSTNSKITKGKNGENVPHYEIIEVVISPLQYCQQRLSTRFKSFVFIYS